MKKLKKFFQKNGFLTHYGFSKIPDHFGTTISYQRFDIKDTRRFSEYIENDFISRSEMPDMSQKLQKKFCESVFEIFSNVVAHSQTKSGIFSCGQFFPQKNMLDFTIADVGVGIPHNVRSSIHNDLPSEEAIDWATKENNTTRQGKIPGGLGLKLIREFIDINKGFFQIVSDTGYWSRKNKKTTLQKLSAPFPGTAVNIEINTADIKSYTMLANEPNL